MEKPIFQTHLRTLDDSRNVFRIIETPKPKHKPIFLPATSFVAMCLASTMVFAAYTKDIGTPKQHTGKIDRSQFLDQLKDKETMRMFAGRMHTEVGSQGRNAQIAWAETTFNRAASRKQSLRQAVTGRYFPTYTPTKSNNPKFHAIIKEVAEDGTNITKGATGNASAGVGFGWGSRTGGQTYAAGGERFGIEKADAKWKPKFLIEDGPPKLPQLAMLPPPKVASLQPDIPDHAPEVKSDLPGVMKAEDRPPQYIGKFPRGLHPVIKASMLKASRHLPPGYKIEFNNAARNSSSVGGSSYHLKHDGKGALAVDIEIIDPKGKHLKNIQSPSTFALYRDFMHWTKKYQYVDFPAYRGKGRWGGYFVSGVSADLMHYDLGPEKGTMAGDWEGGLKREWKHFGRPHDVGVGMGKIASFPLPNPLEAFGRAALALPRAVVAGVDQALHHNHKHNADSPGEVRSHHHDRHAHAGHTKTDALPSDHRHRKMQRRHGHHRVIHQRYKEHRHHHEERDWDWSDLLGF